MDQHEMVEAAVEFIQEHPEKARSVIALLVLPGATTAEGHNGAKAAVILAYQIADEFMLRSGLAAQKAD